MNKQRERREGSKLEGKTEESIELWHHTPSLFQTLSNEIFRSCLLPSLRLCCYGDVCSQSSRQLQIVSKWQREGERERRYKARRNVEARRRTVWAHIKYMQETQGMNLFWRVIKLPFCRIYTHVTLITWATINLFTAEQSYGFKFCCSFLFHILSFVHLVSCVSSSLSAVVCLCISFLCLCYCNILFNLVTTFCASFTSRLCLLAIWVISHPDLLRYPWIWFPTLFICFYNLSDFVKNHSNCLSFK